MYDFKLDNNFEETGLAPKEIVAELDRHIVGQQNAKKAVAIAVRNRWRRQRLDSNMREEITPKNILMIGPTGVGKTEIARRLAKIVGAPFIKVEATKFTEVGYVGKDVESMIRDLFEKAISMVKKKIRDKINAEVLAIAKKRVLDSLVGENSSTETREKFAKLLDEGKLDEKEIEIRVTENPGMGTPFMDIPGMPGGQIGVLNIGEMLGKSFGMGDRTKLKKMLVKDAIEKLMEEESDKLMDEEVVIKHAKYLVENYGIIFLDEVDKIASQNEVRGGNVSREGVQRDLLPLIEGTYVTTKYGVINTEHILFIASGAFYNAKPSDLLPELQGRLPIRVELDSLTKQDMVHILTEPESSLIKQYQALLGTEGVNLNFTDSGIETIAEYANSINRDVENIGARRLHTILEKLLEEVSFAADGSKEKRVNIDELYVRDKLQNIAKQVDLTKMIL